MSDYCAVYSEVLAFQQQYEYWDTVYYNVMRNDPGLERLVDTLGRSKLGSLPHLLSSINQCLAGEVIDALGMGWLRQVRRSRWVPDADEPQEIPNANILGTLQRDLSDQPVEGPPETDPPTLEELKALLSGMVAQTDRKRKQVDMFLISLRSDPSQTERLLALIMAVRSIRYFFDF